MPRPVPRRGVDPKVVVGAVAIPLVVLIGVVAASIGGGDDDATNTTTTTSSTTTTLDEVDPAAREFDSAVRDAFEPLVEPLADLFTSASAWREGSLRDDEFAGKVQGVRDAVALAAGELALVATYEPTPDATALVHDSATLIGLVTDLYDAAIAAGPGDVRTQLDRSAQRVRILSDRVFDRARDLTVGGLDDTEAVDIVLPAGIPDWRALGLTPGPPLEAEAEDDDGDDPGSDDADDDRAIQDEAAWLTFVDGLAAPTADDVAAVAGDADALAVAARKLVEAAMAVRAAPVPDADGSRADRVGLGFLLRAEGARLLQLAALGADAAPGTADALLLISKGPELGP